MQPVNEQAAAVATAPNGKVAEKPKDVRGWLQSAHFQQQVALALPKHMTPERFVRVAITATTRTPKLLTCTPQSVLRCLMDLSALGLEPDGRRAHLIPYGQECTLIVDYKGIVELVLRSGDVSRIHADLVRENDEFEYDRGVITKHKIDFKRTRGKVYAVYCLIVMRDGAETTQVMSLEEIEEVRKRSRSGNNGPWKTDWGEMAKKTAFRRCSKWVRWSSEDLRDKLNKIEEAEGEEEQYPKPVPAAEATIDLSQFLASDDANRGHGNEKPEPNIEDGERPNVGAEPIGEEEIAAIEAARAKAKISPKQLADMLQQYGFSSVRAITVATYASVLKAIEGQE